MTKNILPHPIQLLAKHRLRGFANILDCVSARFKRSHKFQISMLFCSALLAASSALKAGETTCPVWASSDAPVLESKFQGYLAKSDKLVDLGPRLDALENLWFTGTWLSVPSGYLNPWSNSSYEAPRTKSQRMALVSRNPSRTGFNTETKEFDASLLAKSPESAWFSFWMPSLRYVERNMRLGVNLRPCEAGRPLPSNEDYVVKFTILWANESGAQNSLAVQKLLRMEEHLEKTGQVFAQHLASREHTLNGPISGRRNYDIFSSSDELALDLNCSPFFGSDISPNPLCHGVVWYKRAGLVARIMFPSDQGQIGEEEFWRQPVEAVAELVRELKISARPLHVEAL